MTKQELCRQIAEEMLDEQLLNEADTYDIYSLLEDVEKLVSRNLKDFALVYKSGVVED